VASTLSEGGTLSKLGGQRVVVGRVLEKESVDAVWETTVVPCSSVDGFFALDDAAFLLLRNGDCEKICGG